jgi:hypothetical protein
MQRREGMRIQSFGNPDEKRHYEEPGINWRTALKWFLKKWGRAEWAGFV